MNLSMPEAVAMLAVAFGGWAWVVAWGVNIVRREVEGIRKAVDNVAVSAHETAETLTKHILVTEKRLTMLETEFGYLRRYLTAHESD